MANKRNPNNYCLRYKKKIWMSNKHKYRYIPRQTPLDKNSAAMFYQTIVLRNVYSGYNAGVDMSRDWFFNRFNGMEHMDVVKFLCSLSKKEWALVQLEQKL